MDKVTVIIPSYNHKDFIEESINSVLNQDYKNIEVIVIDDGSKDGSVELLRELASTKEFRLVIKENQGICATLNMGLSLAKGDFITFIASDDYMPLTRVTEQIEAFKAHIDVDVIAGTVKVIDEKSNIIASKLLRAEGYISLDQMFRKNMVYAPTAMFKKQFFSKYGKYREDYLFEDYFMWLKTLSAGGKIYNVNKSWAFYRINTGNLEKRFNWYFNGYVQTLSDYLPDPRAQAALKHYLLIYCAKMTFLKGSDFYRGNSDKISKLRIHDRVALKMITFIPSFLRQKILLYLIKEL